MRTHTEVLKEIRDRLTYFCLRTDGRYDPPWTTELVGIIDEAMKNSHEVRNSEANHETLANIVAEMRREVGYGKDTYCGKRVIRRMEDVRVMQFCDRIEAAWRRDEERAVEHATRHAEAVARDNCRDCVHNPNGKNYEVGNAAAMYEALKTIHDKVNSLDEECGVDPVEVRDIARAAMSAPARNCDRPECATSKAAQGVWRKEDGGKTPYYEWLLSPAKKKGEGDGR